MRSSLAFLAAARLGATAATAEPAVDARYAVQTMGVDLGRAELASPADGGLTTLFRFETDALLGFVEASDTRMATESASARGQVSPRRFEGVYQKEDRTRRWRLPTVRRGGSTAFTPIKRHGPGRCRAEGTVGRAWSIP